MPTYGQRTRESRGNPAALAGEAFTRGIGSNRKGYSDKIADFFRERQQNLDYFTHVERFLRLPAVNADQTGDTFRASVEYIATAVDMRFFTANVACIVTAVRLTVTVQGTGGAATVLVEKVPSGTAIGSGTDIITSGLNVVGTANTVEAASLGTAGVRTLAAGDSLALDFTGTLTSAIGVITCDITLIDAAGLPRAANPDFELQGTGASDDDVTFLEGGGIRLETDGSDADQEIIAAHLDTSQSALAAINWDSRNEPLFACNLVPGPQAADTHFANIWAGFKLTNTDVVITDDEGFYFRVGANNAALSASPSNWHVVQSVGGTDVIVDTGIAIATGVPNQLLVVLDQNRVPQYYIDGAKVWTGTRQAAALATYEFYIGIAARGAGAAKQLDVRNLIVSQLYG